MAAPGRQYHRGMRLLGLAVLVLVALVVIQAAALRRMRHEIAHLKGLAGAYDLEVRRDEIARTGVWLHAWLQTAGGGSRPQGLCPDGAPDMDTIRSAIFGVYLQWRATGATEAEARQEVMRRVTP